MSAPLKSTLLGALLSLMATADAALPLRSLESYLKASNTGFNDQFGAAVAVSGDWAVVGVPGEDSAPNAGGDDDSLPDSGAAYLFQRTGAQWVQQAMLKASHADAFDHFGAAVAMDGPLMVIGAPGEDSDARSIDGDGSNNLRVNSGAAYVYFRTNGIWVQQAYLKAFNADPWDAFGKAVTISGHRVAVAAPDEDGISPVDPFDNSLFDRGAIYIYSTTNQAWSFGSYVKVPEPLDYIRVGSSLALSGDLLMCAESDPGSQEEIEVFLFERQGTNWITHFFDATAGVGSVVALSGNRAVVGLPWRSNGAGEVHVLDLGSLPTGGLGVLKMQTLRPMFPDTVDEFGKSVAIDRDQILIGAPREDSGIAGITGVAPDNSTFDSGAAYLFAFQEGLWVQRAYVKASNPGEVDAFGTAVAISGDRVLIGAPTEDSAATGTNGDDLDNSNGNSGAVYAYDVQLANLPQPEIEILAAGMTVADGDRTPDPQDLTEWGSVVGQTPTISHSFVVTNHGSAYLRISALILSNLTPVEGSAPDFAVVNPPPELLPPGGHATFELAFTPRLPGPRPWLFTLRSNDPDEAAYDFEVAGAGIGTPVMSVIGNGLAIADGDTTPRPEDATDFGGLGLLDAGVSRPFIIQNNGNLDLVLPGEVITGPHRLDFTAATNTPTSVRPGEGIVLSIYFDALQTGAREATIEIPSNDPQRPRYSFAVSGIGAPYALDPRLEAHIAGPTMNSGVGEPLAVAADLIALTGYEFRPGTNGMDYFLGIYSREGRTWKQEAWLPLERKPNSVDALHQTVVVGDPEHGEAVDGSPLPGSGAVYVYGKTGTNWARWETLKASNADPNDEFGKTVVLEGQYLAVSAPAEDSAARGANGNQADNTLLDSGAVYIYERPNTNWLESAYLKDSRVGEISFRLGSRMAMWQHRLVALINEGEGAGLLVFENLNGWHMTDSFDQAGFDVATSGQGIISPPYSYVNPSGLEWVPSHSILPRTGESDTGGLTGRFGEVVRMSGTKVIVGDRSNDAINEGYLPSDAKSRSHLFPDDQELAQDSGSAFLLDLTEDRWRQQAFIKGLTRVASLGAAVDIFNQTIVLTAEGTPATGINGDYRRHSIFRRDGLERPLEPELETGSVHVYSIHPDLFEPKLVGELIEDSKAIYAKCDPDRPLKTAVCYGTVDYPQTKVARFRIFNAGGRTMQLEPPRVEGDFHVVVAPDDVPFDTEIIMQIGFTPNTTLGVQKSSLILQTTELVPQVYGECLVAIGVGSILIDIHGNGRSIPAGITSASRPIMGPFNVPTQADDTDFGRVLVSDVVTNWFTIGNSGNVPARINGFGLIDHQSDFSLIIPTNEVVERTFPIDLGVVFKPTQPWRRRAIIRFIEEKLDRKYFFQVVGEGRFPAPRPTDWDGYFRGSPIQAGASAGQSLDVEGATAVVGAPTETVNGESEAGAAYVHFRREAGFWIQEAHVSPAQPLSGEQFGAAVAITGDTLVIGAPASGRPENAGSVYVFTRTNAVWTQRSRLQSSTPTAGDRFGGSLDISGDTIAVGADGEPSGAVYVFTGAGDNWTLQTRIPGPVPNSGFGGAVSISGDRIAIGAPDDAGENGDAPGAGIVYVHHRNNDTWTLEGELRAEFPDAGDRFGVSLGISGARVAVGAPGEDGSPPEDSDMDGILEYNNDLPDSGVAYVFHLENDEWKQEAYLKASNLDANDRFGAAVDIYGLGVVVGAPKERGNAIDINGDGSNNSLPNAGAAYVFEWTPDGWVQEFYLKSHAPDSDDEYGSAVAADYAVALIGAPKEDSSLLGDPGDNGSLDSGGAYLYTLTAGVTASPVIELSGNGLPIANNSPSNRPEDGTDFGTVKVHFDAATNRFEVLNPGSTQLRVHQMTPLGNHPQDFAVIQPELIVAPGERSFLDVIFDPTISGLRDAQVRLRHASPVTNEFVLTIQGFGSGIPVITVPPPPERVIEENEPIHLSVVALGDAPLSHQWRREGIALPDQTNAMLEILNAPRELQGAFDVVISNHFGAVTSSLANVIIQPSNTLPRIVQQPASQMLPAGWFVQWETTLAGAPPFFHQWRREGVDLPNETNPTLNLFNLQIADSGNYDVVVTNAFGSTTSQVARLTVALPQAPMITQQPQTVVGARGSNIVISVSATGFPLPSFSWVRGGSQIPGAGEASLIISNATVADAGSYTVTVANSAGAVTSDPIVLTVLDPPVFTQVPSSLVAMHGQTVQFSSAAIGEPPIHFIWLKSSTPLMETNNTLILSQIGRQHEGAYQILASNTVGVAISSNAFLRVLVPQSLLIPDFVTGDRLRLRFQDPDESPHSLLRIPNFEVQSAENIRAASWQTLTNPMLVTNGLIQIEHQLPTGTPRRFYRVIER